MMKPAELQKTAASHLQTLASLVFQHTPAARALIVYDRQSSLADLLTQAYRAVLPEAATIDFDRTAPETILKQFETLGPGDWVILIQSDSFRLNKFRIRLSLFERRLKVIEHPHLARMREDEYPIYVDALSYDPTYYRILGPRLKEQIDRAKRIEIIGRAVELVYDSTFLAARLNIGDYRGMKNTGGQFPIGEVFTEPEHHDQVSGAVEIFAYGGADFSVRVPEKPFTAVIENGRLISCSDAPEDFHAVLRDIREKEDVVWVRELGFGLNRALTRTRRVTDIGTYERMCGIHLSLGAKHLQYKKPEFPKKGGFHVDVFLNAEQVSIDTVCVYKDERYL